MKIIIINQIFNLGFYYTPLSTWSYTTIFMGEGNYKLK